MRTRGIAVITGLTTIALTLGSGVLAASADVPAAASTTAVVTPQGACDTSRYFNEVSSSTSAWTGLTPKYSTTNNTGQAVTSTFTVQQGGTYSASLSGTIEGSISDGIATAKASVTGSITKSVSWNTTLSVQATVPAHSSRYAQFGTTVYKVYIQKVHYSGNCTRSVASTGTLTAPSTTGWKVTES